MIDLLKENYQFLFKIIIIWFLISIFIAPILRGIKNGIKTMPFLRNKYIHTSIYLLKFVLFFSIIFILIDLQIKFNLININSKINGMTLVISILTIYGILYAFIQFALGYSNQKENDKYWGESTIEVMLNQGMDFSFFHSSYFKFILLYSVVFPLINFEVIPIVDEFQIYMLAFWQVCIAIIYVLYVLLFTKSMFIMKRLFSLQKTIDFSTKHFIKRKKKEDYLELFTYSFQNKKTLFLDALFREVRSLEDSEKKEVFKTILIDTLYSYKEIQDKMIQKQKQKNKDKKKKKDLYFFYRSFSYLYSSESLKEIDLSFNELLNIYRATEKIIYNELILSTDNKSELVTEYVNLYSRKNNFYQESSYGDIPQLIWNKIGSNDDLHELHFYMNNSDIQKLIDQKLSNEQDINLNKLINSRTHNYIIKLLDQSKEYLQAFENRTSTFVFKNNKEESIKNNIYHYILNLEFTEENKRYIEILIKNLDYKYKVSLVFFIMLYPKEEEFRNKQKDVLFLQRITHRSKIDDEISNPEVRAFVIHKIGESYINHKIRPELIESIFKHLKMESTDIDFIQSSINQQYLSYAKMLKIKFIIDGNYISWLDSSALNNKSVKQNKNEIDWKVTFIHDILKTPSLFKKSYFQKHINLISKEIFKTATLDLYDENDFRFFYVNPWFELPEKKLWQLIWEKQFLNDGIIEFLTLKLVHPGYEYLLTNNKVRTLFKQRMTQIIYRANENVEGYVYDLAKRANEVSVDSFIPELKIEMIIQKLQKLIYS